MVWRGQAKRMLQQDLAWRRVEQVGTAHHLGNALSRIVHHHCQLIRPKPIGTQQDEVANVAVHPLVNVTMHEVVEIDFAIVMDAQANRGIMSF